MQTYQILLFYKYVHIENPEKLVLEQRELQASLGLTGRCIVASEGINFTVEGTTENTEKYIEKLNEDPRFSGIDYKKSPGTGNSFPKINIKVRREIVTLGLDSSCDIDPNKTTGKRLLAEELHEWINSGKEFYIVDMRNHYEHLVGYFEGSICPPMDNFRDLPKFLSMLEHLKDKTVVTVCTGGVRCEKASGFLVANGFNDVYQLHNGIVTYMEKYPNENFLGKLYVFDQRMYMGFYTDDPKHKVVGKCHACGIQSERFTNCAHAPCHRQIIACEECETKLGKSLTCDETCILKTKPGL